VPLVGFIIRILLKESKSPFIYHIPFYVITVMLEYKVSCKGKGKGKAIQLQAWTGPKGSRRLRLPDFRTIGT